MTQHFLLNAQARSMSLRQIFALSDDAAFDFFRKSRWGNGDEVTCPCCGSIAKHYFISTRKQWRCRDCKHTFSLTSGTLFAFHKLPLKVYLGAVAIYTNAVKGISALQLSRDLDVQYKTAFVLAHNLTPIKTPTVRGGRLGVLLLGYPAAATPKPSPCCPAGCPPPIPAAVPAPGLPSGLASA